MLAFTRLVVLFGIISLSGCDVKNQVKSKIEPIFKNDQEILSRQVLMYIKGRATFTTLTLRCSINEILTLVDLAFGHHQGKKIDITSGF